MKILLMECICHKNLIKIDQGSDYIIYDKKQYALTNFNNFEQLHLPISLF